MFFFLRLRSTASRQERKDLWARRVEREAAICRALDCLSSWEAVCAVHVAKIAVRSENLERTKRRKEKEKRNKNW